MTDRFVIKHPDGRKYKLRSLAKYQELYEPQGFKIDGDIDALDLQDDQPADAAGQDNSEDPDGESEPEIHSEGPPFVFGPLDEEGEDPA